MSSNDKKGTLILNGLDLKELRHEIGGGVFSIRSALLNIKQNPSLAEEVLKSALEKLAHAVEQIDRVRQAATQSARKPKVDHE